MKRIIFLVFVIFLFVPLFSAVPTQNQKQAVFMMNYAQYVTYKLKTYNNILALEEEYKNLKDNMNYETIQDEDSVDTVNRLMESIYNESKNNKNRSRLKRSVERRMNNALFDSIPQVTTIVAGGMNPFSLAVNTARTVGGIFVSYQQYKNKLSEEYDEKMFEYQILTEDILDDIYMDLNTYTFRLMKRYKISDEWRLNETELEKMFRYIKDTSVQRAYTNLRNMNSDRFVQHFPMFWYHLAKIAYDAGYESEALNYFNRFETENVEIFRYDYIAVDAYKGKVSILLKNQEANKNEILNKLSFIEKNKSSWQDFYFCSLVYAQLHDIQNAKRLLERNINELSSKIDQQFVQGKYLDDLLAETSNSGGGVGFFKSNENVCFEVAGCSDYDGLELCRALLNKLGDSKIYVSSVEDQYKKDTQCVNEILYLFGLNPSSYVLKNSKDQIGRVLVSSKLYSEKACQIDVKIPLQWVMSSNTNLEAVFCKKGSNNSFKVLLKIDEKETKKLRKSKATPKDTILYYTSGKINLNWKKEKYYFSGIFLKHPVYPVEFKYFIDIDKPSKNIRPNMVSFNGNEYGL